MNLTYQHAQKYKINAITTINNTSTLPLNSTKKHINSYGTIELVTGQGDTYRVLALNTSICHLMQTSGIQKCIIQNRALEETNKNKG